jgi:hypothetical protein
MPHWPCRMMSVIVQRLTRLVSVENTVQSASGHPDGL